MPRPGPGLDLRLECNDISGLESFLKSAYIESQQGARQRRGAFEVPNLPQERRNMFTLRCCRNRPASDGI